MVNTDNVMQGSVLDAKPKKGILQMISDAFISPAGAAEMTQEDLLNMGAMEPGKVFGNNLTDQGKALETFRNSATNFYNSPNNTANTPGAALGFMTDPARAGISKYDSIRENKSFIQDAINQGFLETEADYTDQKPLDQYLANGGLASMFTRRG